MRQFLFILACGAAMLLGFALRTVVAVDAPKASITIAGPFAHASAAAAWTGSSAARSIDAAASPIETTMAGW